MAVASDSLTVEVAYAKPERQCVLTLRVEPGVTAREAVQRSGIVNTFPEIDLNAMPLGVFGRQVGGDHPLRDGDRVEIYRPLIVDPKEARRERARIGNT